MRLFNSTKTPTLYEIFFFLTCSCLFVETAEYARKSIVDSSDNSTSATAATLINVLCLSLSLASLVTALAMAKTKMNDDSTLAVAEPASQSNNAENIESRHPVRHSRTRK